MADLIKNLVQVGPFSRVVEYSVEEGIVLGIRNVFADVPGVAEAKTLFLQRKDEEWGEFIDVGKDETIADRCVVKVVLDLKQSSMQVQYILVQHTDLLYIVYTAYVSPISSSL